MAESFQFEVVTSNGDIVSEDGVSRSNEDNSNTQSARAQRQEENHQLRLEAAERARQREEDRIEDRKERRAKRRASEERQQDLEVQRRRNHGFRVQEAQQRALIAAETRGHTQRRRFINDFFGAFNRAHLGRRINHGIDFINALTAPDRGRSTGNSIDPTSVAHASRLVSKEFADRKESITSSRERDFSQRRSDVTRDILRDRVRDQVEKSQDVTTNNTTERIVTNNTETVRDTVVDRNSNSSADREDLVNRISNPQPQTTPSERRQRPSVKPQRIREREARREVIRDRIRARQSAGLLDRFRRISQRVGPQRAANLLTSRALGNVPRVGGALQAVFSKVGVAGLAAGGALLGVTAVVGGSVIAFRALNAMTGRLISSLDGIPSPVLFAQIETQFEILNAKFRRAERLGD